MAEKAAKAVALVKVMEAMEEEEEEEEMFLEEEEEDDFMMQSAIVEEAKRRTGRGRRWCVRPLNRTRQVDGLYSTLILKMRELDEERHFSILRMSPSRFDDLLRRIEPMIQHAPTHSAPISPAERLAITLVILANGGTQNFVSATYKMGKSTACAIVTEVCRAIWWALKEEFVAFPTPVQFREIAKDYWRL